MYQQISDLARPRGRYGVDGDYRLIPAPVVFACYLLLCLAEAALTATWLAAGRALAGGGVAIGAIVMVAVGVSILRFSRRGKFEFGPGGSGIGLRGDERVLDLGWDVARCCWPRPSWRAAGNRCWSGHLATRPDRQLHAGHTGERRRRRRRRQGRAAHPRHDRLAVPRVVLRSRSEQPRDP